MELDLSLFISFLAVGLAAGFLAGFVGIGGGIIMVPVLLEIFRSAGVADEVVVQTAMATSLSAGVFSVASSIIRHHRQQRIHWRLVTWLAPGCIFGGWLAAFLAIRIPGQLLILVLSGLMLFAAFRMIRSRDNHAPVDQKVSVIKTGLTGLMVGLVAGFSGLAGGVVLVPALGLILGVQGNWLAGTSSATIIFSALAATAGYIFAEAPASLGSGFLGYVCFSLTLPLALGAVPAAQLGAWANRRVSGNLFRRIFGILLLVIVVRLLTTV